MQVEEKKLITKAEFGEMLDDYARAVADRRHAAMVHNEKCRCGNSMNCSSVYTQLWAHENYRAESAKEKLIDAIDWDDDNYTIPQGYTEV